MTALISFERVFEVLDLKPLVAERPGATRCPTVRSVSSSTACRSATPRPTRCPSPRSRPPDPATAGRRRQVLHDVTLRIEPGQLVALVGPSGAGKTTLTSLVSRLYDPTSGAVRVGGRDLRDVTLASLRGRLGMVTQEAHLFHDTIRANLLYARPDADRRPGRRGAEGGPDQRPRRGPPRGAGHRGRRPRPSAQWWREAAPRHRAAAAQGARRRRARRGDRPPRLGV